MTKNRAIKISAAITKVIIFFDIFDYPLTLKEIWQFISLKCELVEISNILNAGVANISLQNNFYFLSGRENNIKERLERYGFADKKFKIALFVAKIFKFIPWIKMVTIGNLLGARNLKNNSDIDLFIITENKRIWLTRFFCICVIKLLGLRPQINNKKNKICLSFYISLSALDLSKLRMGQDDWYFTYWLACLTLLYNTDETYQKLIKANKWLNARLPNWQLNNTSECCQTGQLLFKFYHNFIDLFFCYLEQRFKTLQLKILPQKLKNMKNNDTRVVINDQIIKLHSNDRREKYNRIAMK
ncbi:MAG: hypothetical protein ABH818_01585 [Patescibacteria group bacterium]|nr:hypothetical protein [Patescibacteria group bacterium]MBU1871002.1 hypothetical protein [Patescibacteria group bacterium]